MKNILISLEILLLNLTISTISAKEFSNVKFARDSICNEMSNVEMVYDILKPDINDLILTTKSSKRKTIYFNFLGNSGENHTQLQKELICKISYSSHSNLGKIFMNNDAIVHILNGKHKVIRCINLLKDQELQFSSKNYVGNQIIFHFIRSNGQVIVYNLNIENLNLD